MRAAQACEQLGRRPAVSRLSELELHIPDSDAALEPKHAIDAPDVIAALLKDLLELAGFLEADFGNVTGALNMGILKEKSKFLTDNPAIREFLGEYKDPVINYATSIGKMSELLEKHNFLVNITKLGLEQGFLSEKMTPEHTVKIEPAIPDLPDKQDAYLFNAIKIFISKILTITTFNVTGISVKIEDEQFEELVEELKVLMKASGESEACLSTCPLLQGAHPCFRRNLHLSI